jgi:hypothetical protein
VNILIKKYSSAVTTIWIFVYSGFPAISCEQLCGLPGSGW